MKVLTGEAGATSSKLREFKPSNDSIEIRTRV